MKWENTHPFSFHYLFRVTILLVMVPNIASFQLNIYFLTTTAYKGKYIFFTMVQQPPH